MLRKANPDMEETAIPVELVTCSDSRFLGVFGEKTVNVLEVNLRDYEKKSVNNNLL